MSPSEFETRLQECLDARRDPLDDEALVAFLDAHPDWLAAFAGLCADLAALPAAAFPVFPVTRPQRPWRSLVGIAALAVAGAACLMIALRRGPSPNEAPSRILSTRFEELRPTALLTATFEVRQTLTTAGTRVVLFERRSERR